MSEENKKSQNENRPRFNREQYDLLKKCSDKKDITEWNQYRIDNPEIDVELEGEDADFQEWYLKGVFFHIGLAEFKGSRICFTGDVYLGGANFNLAHLEEARFIGSHLEDATLAGAHLENAILTCAYMEAADLNYTYLADANLSQAHLEWAEFEDAHLERTNFEYTHLDKAELNYAYLQGARFNCAIIKGAIFNYSEVDEKTEIFMCKIDKETDFRNVDIDNIRMESGTKQLLKYNIRRMNWEDWYKEHKILKRPVWLFWQTSDYGSSSLRIIGWFFGLAFGFAIIYRIWPGLVMVRGGADHLRDFIHALYFSVVTMTTLGFGDIAANPDSHCGQVLLMIQVILGYGLLGALITRLAILFTGEGPAGKFADKKKN